VNGSLDNSILPNRGTGVHLFYLYATKSTKNLDPNVSGNSVVGVVQAYLLTSSGGCWVYQSQTFTV
jgi:hypothetical protein